MRPASIGVDHSNSHFRIWVSRVRIFLTIYGRVVGNKVGDRILRDLHLVHLQVCDVLSVGGPEVVAANIEFLLIDPIDLAVEDVFSFIFIRERQLVLA